MESNVPKAFEIIIQHFCGHTFCQSQEEIYNRVNELDQDEGSERVILEDVRRTLRYLKDFGLVKKPRPQRCWHIKSVADMDERLCALINNRDTGNDGQPLKVVLAFEIIIQHFSGDNVWRSTTEIKNRVFNVRENQEDAFRADSVLSTLRFLTHFGFAKKANTDEKPEGHTEEDYWRIKSVDDMCDRLRALDDNRNSGRC